MEICRMPRCQNIILSKIFRAKRLWWCNDRLCLYKNIRLKFKYQLLILCFIIQRSSKLCSWRLAVRLWQENCQHLAVWNTLYFLIFTTIFFTESRLLSVFGFLLKGVRLQQFFFFACLSDVTVFRTVCSSSVVSLSSMKLPSSISRFFCSWTSFRITFSIRNTVRSYSNFWYSRSCKVTVLPLSS